MSCIIKRILTFKNAITFMPIKIMDLTGEDMTNIYMYSWSTDGVCWTNWVNYEQYLHLAKHVEGDFYARILVTGSIGDVFLDNAITTCYSVCIMQNQWNMSVCDDPNLFQPYANLDCALLLQQQLADNVICMLGIPIYYFRCEPDQDTADFTFKEFALHNVVACRQLKLMIPDGEMPSSNPKLGQFDFDWEIDWETELSKTQFAAAFGDTAIPKQRDFIYIPMMKRMWEVNSAYDEKKEGLLWRSTTWKLALVKYSEATNIGTEGFEDAIDTFINRTYENTFGELEQNEQERQSGYGQIPAESDGAVRFEASNLYDIIMEDNVRKSYTREDVSVIDKMFCHHHTIVARNIYKFKNENGCITYQKGICGESGTISFIIETPGYLQETISKDFAEFGPIIFEVAYEKESQQFLMGVEDLYCNLEPFTTYLVIYKWSRQNHTKELCVYRQDRRRDLPVYLLKPESYWFDFENPVTETVGTYNQDYIINSAQRCQIHCYPFDTTNIKLYNQYLLNETAIAEALKYVTNHESCVFNDLARPISAGRGYQVR